MGVFSSLLNHPPPLPPNIMPPGAMVAPPQLPPAIPAPAAAAIIANEGLASERKY